MECVVNKGRTQVCKLSTVFLHCILFIVGVGEQVDDIKLGQSMITYLRNRQQS